MRHLLFTAAALSLQLALSPAFAIADTTSGATIHYTTDGSTPTASSPVYSGPITVNSAETINAIAVASGYTQSAVGSFAYTITTQPAAGGPYTDNFTGTSGSALASPPWTEALNGFTYAGNNTAQGSSAGESIAVYTGGSFTSNQYAKAIYSGNPDMGLVVMGSTGGSAYVWTLQYTSVLLFTNGSYTKNAGGGCPTPSSGDTIQLADNNGSITCTDVTTGASGTFTDTTLTSGYPGIYAEKNQLVPAVTMGSH